MIIDFRQLEEIKAQFDALGRSMSDLSSASKGTFNSLSVSMEKLNYSLKNSIPIEGLNKLTEATNEIVKKVSEFTNLIDSYLGKFDNITPATDALLISGDIFRKLSSDLSEIKNHKGLGGAKRGFTSGASGGLSKSGKSGGIKIPASVRKTLDSASRNINKLASKMHLPGPGNMLKGTLLWMAFGFQDGQRLKALLGQSVDVLVPAFDSSVKKLVDSASGWLRDFSETMHQFYGMGKDEVFAVESVFIAAGVGIGQSINKVADKSLGMVGQNLVSYSFALDKMFNLATGTSANSMVHFAKEFGQSMSEAKDSVTKMYFMGRESGLGGEYFVSNLQKTSKALSELGISVDSVSNFLFTMQNRLRAIGVPKHLAGKEAAQGLQQISQGLSSMSVDWKVLLGEQLYGKKDLEAKQEFEYGLLRMVDNPEDFEEYISKVVDIVRERTSSEAQLREVLEKAQGGLGLGISGARSALLANKAVKSGDTFKSEDYKKEIKAFREELKGTFEREKSKESQFRLAFNKMMLGLAKIGRGLLALAINFMTRLYLAMKSAPVILANLFAGKSGQQNNLKLLAAIDKQTSKDLPDIYDEMQGGAEQLAEGGQEALGAVVGEALNTMADSFSLDAFGGASEEPKVPRGSGKDPYGQSHLQVVRVPVASSGAYDAPPTEEKDPINDKSMLEHILGSNDKAWKGHGVKIVNYGVDDSGNIMLGLIGDCPRCALVFGSKMADITSSSSLPGTGGVSDNKVEGFIQSAPSRRSLKAEDVSSLSGISGESNVDAFTQMLYTEGGVHHMKNNKKIEKINTERGRMELAGIGFTALNRLNKGQGKDLNDIITSGQGYGKQGYGKKGSGIKREYGTDRAIQSSHDKKTYAKVRQFAEKILSGKVANPVGGATMFAHNLKGKAYAGNSYAPKFALNNNNRVVAASEGGNSAIFVENKGMGAVDIPQKDEILKKYKRAYDKKHSSSLDSGNIYDPDVE